MAPCALSPVRSAQLEALPSESLSLGVEIRGNGHRGFPGRRDPVSLPVLHNPVPVAGDAKQSQIRDARTAEDIWQVTLLLL